MAIKIAITGPESSGKTTLAKQLADALDGICVAEFARSYLERRDSKPALSDLVHICLEQMADEDRAETLGKPVICDTDILVLKIWAEVVFDEVPPEIEQAFASRQYDFTLLCKPDLEWESDPLRSMPSMADREALFERYERILIESNRKYYVVEGQGIARFESALKKINRLF